MKRRSFHNPFLRTNQRKVSLHHKHNPSHAHPYPKPWTASSVSMPCVRRSAKVDPRSSTPTRAHSSRPMPSPPACSLPTSKSAWMAEAAPSTTSSANVYGAASSMRTSISTSMTPCLSCTPAYAHTSTSTTMSDHTKVSTIAHPRKSTSCSDYGRSRPSGSTLFFPFRGPKIGAHHTTPTT